jgi:hypothetical protein
VMDMETEGPTVAGMWAPVRMRRRHPTRWWRYLFAQDYDVRTVRTMRAFLAKVDLPDEARWIDAATGDAAAAIGIAFKYSSLGLRRRNFDLAMTALAVCAFRGSAAARLVLAKQLHWLPDGGEAENRIADSWLALRFAANCACRCGTDSTV